MFSRRFVDQSTVVIGSVKKARK